MRRTFLRGLAGMTTMAMALLQVPLRSGAEEIPDFSMLGAVGTLSAEQTQCVAQSIYKGLSEHADRVRFDYNKMDYIAPTEENLDSLMDVYVTIIGGWDVGILAVKNHASYTVGSSAAGGCITGMSLLYLVDDAVYDTEYASLMEQLDTITAAVDPDWSAPEKALYLHEYLAIHYDYDYDALNASTASDIPHTAYGILTNGKAVCEGYTWLYNLLLRRVGIESLSVISSSLNHTWNMLYIDGNWYHVDVTWDDNSNTHPGRVKHDSFLKDRDAMIESGHTSTDWILTTGQSETILPESKKYNDAFWTKSNAAIQYDQGAWFVIRPSESAPTNAFFERYTFHAADGSAEVQIVNSVSDKWRVFDNSGYFYNANYTIPSENMGVIYYTTPTSIMAYQNDRHIWICNLTPEQELLGYIYGMYTEGDTLYYAVSESPSAEATLFSISLTEYYDRIREEASESPKTSVSSTSTIPETSTTTTSTSGTTTTTASTTSMSSTTSTSSTTTTTVSTTSTSGTTTTTASTTSTSSTTTTVSTTSTSDTTTTTTSTTEDDTQMTETTVLPTENSLCGDLDGDGTLTVLDVVTLNRFLLGVISSDGLYIQNADMLEDGIIDIFDLALLKRALLTVQ